MSGRTFDTRAPLLVLEPGEERDLIEQRLQLLVGARLRGLAAEEGRDGGAEAGVVARGLDAGEQLGAGELLALGRDRGGGGAEAGELLLHVAVPGEAVAAGVELLGEGF